MSRGWRRFSTAEIISAAYLAGQGKSGDEIASVLRISLQNAYALLHRYGISLVHKQGGQGCVGPLVLNDDEIEASIRLPVEMGLPPERALSLAVGGLLKDDLTFKRIVANELRSRK
jgi:hypothetical protein